MNVRNGLAVIALAALPFAALATQDATVKPIGLSIRAGVFFPSSNSAQGEGKTWFNGGLEYKIGNLGFGNAEPGYSASYSISVDYYGLGDFRNVPVLLNYVGRVNEFFYSAGAGLGAAKYREGLASTKNRTEFSYQVSVGYDFVKGSTPVFLEAKYFGCAKSDLNGFAINLGVRF